MTCLALLLLSGCRSMRHVGDGPPLRPLTSTDATEAAQQLAARRSQFHGERSLIRLRFAMGDRQQSARAQLQVDPSLRTLLTVYTPMGTTAARLYTADGEVLFLNDVEKTAWRGRAADLNGVLDTFASQAAVLLAIGLPPGGDVAVTYSRNGMARATVGDIVVDYDPPSYPPSQVHIGRGDQRIDMEHLESVEGSEALRAPEIPDGYRCCVPPQS